MLPLDSQLVGMRQVQNKDFMVVFIHDRIQIANHEKSHDFHEISLVLLDVTAFVMEL